MVLGSKLGFWYLHAEHFINWGLIFVSTTSIETVHNRNKTRLRHFSLGICWQGPSREMCKHHLALARGSSEHTVSTLHFSLSSALSTPGTIQVSGQRLKLRNEKSEDPLEAGSGETYCQHLRCWGRRISKDFKFQSNLSQIAQLTYQKRKKKMYRTEYCFDC